MNKIIIGILLIAILLSLTGCGFGSGIKKRSFMRENVSLEHIKTIAVPPYQGKGASRIHNFTITRILDSGFFDVVDPDQVGSIMRRNKINAKSLDTQAIRMLGKLLKVEAILLGSVEQKTQSRGSARFVEIVMTLRLLDCDTGLILWQASGQGSSYSTLDRLFGFAPKDTFDLTMNLLDNLFATMN